MAQTILHIGTNKTGTSSLQYWLNENQKVLERHGVIYPDIGREGCAHHELSRAIKHTKGDAASLGKLKSMVAARRENSDLVIFSSEAFHTIQRVEYVAEVFGVDNVKIIIYVREHVSYLVSWYQQAIQSRNISMSVNEFAALNFKSLDAMVSRWSALFGPDNVEIAVFDRSLLKGRDIVTDFCTRFIKEELLGLCNRTADKNLSISGNLLFLKRALNLFISNAEAKAIAGEIGALSVLDKTFQGSLSVDAETVNYLRRLTADDRRRLWERGVHLPEPPTEIHGVLSPSLERLNFDLDMIISRLASKASKGSASPTLEILTRVMPSLVKSHEMPSILIDK